MTTTEIYLSVGLAAQGCLIGYLMLDRFARSFDAEDCKNAASDATSAAALAANHEANCGKWLDKAEKAAAQAKAHRDHVQSLHDCLRVLQPAGPKSVVITGQIDFGNLPQIDSEGRTGEMKQQHHEGVQS